MSEFIKGYGHTAFRVSDMEASIKFYREALGFEKAFEINDDNGNPWIVYMYIGDGQFIELFYGDKNGERARGNIGYEHICLETLDIHKTADNIVKTGNPLDAAPDVKNDGNWQCWTHDPDGNRIEIMQMNADSLQKNYADTH